MQPVEMVRIPADLSKPVERVQLAPELEVFQQEVGGYVQGVDLPGSTMWLDEEGKLKEKPVNARATALGRIFGRLQQDVAVGDVICVGYDYAADTYWDVPDRIAQLAEDMAP